MPEVAENRISLQLMPDAEWLQSLSWSWTDPALTGWARVLELPTPAGVTLNFVPSTNYFILDDTPLDQTLYSTRLAVLRLMRGLGVSVPHSLL